jgi:hypothetical protein
MSPLSDAEGSTAIERDRLASKPVLADLRTCGIEIDSVWDLYKVPGSRSRAIPVLLKHLRRDYPDRVLEGIGQGLDNRSAEPWWEDIRTLLVETEHPVVRDRAACALATCATQKHYGDLVSLISDASLGECRIYFLRPAHRIGNRIRPGQGRAAIESAALDPVLAREANTILTGRSRTQ